MTGRASRVLSAAISKGAIEWALLAAVLAVLSLNARHYWPFISDDALISLRYARRLAAGQGLTWTDGERVEGYTDFLWVLLVALFVKLRANPLEAARALDFLGAMVAIVCVSSRPLPFELRAIRVMTGGLALALSAPIAVWSIGGLEHGFMCGVLAVGLVLVTRAFRKRFDAADADAAFVPQPRAHASVRDAREFLIAGIPFAALVLLRADGIVLLVGALCGIALALTGLLGRTWARATPAASLYRTWPRAALAVASFLAVPAALLLLQLAFRAVYYHALVPNTALAKVSLNAERLRGGFDHLRGAVKPLWPMLVAAVMLSPFALRRPPRAELWVPLSVMLAWCSYVVVVGGDIFPGWRQHSLALVPLAALIAEFADRVATSRSKTDRVSTSRWKMASIGVIVGLLVFSAVLQLIDPENVRAKQELWEWEGLPVGRALKTAFGARRPLLGVDAAGALPYWSELPALDMLGLNDAYLARHPPPGFGHGEIGHELGNGAYVFRRRPDLIAFNNASGSRDPMFRSGRELLRMPEFLREYELVRVLGQNSAVTGELYIRREGGKLGIERSDDRIVVPGYFFAASEGTIAELDRDELIAPISRHSAGVIDPIALSAGTWLVETDPPGPSVSFRCPYVSAVRDSLEIEAPSIRLIRRGSLRITLGPGTEGAGVIRLRTVTLRRIDGPARQLCTTTEPLVVTLADFLAVPPEHSSWSGPGTHVVSNFGMLVDLRSVIHPTTVHISTDANDLYEIVFLVKGTELARTQVGPARDGAGITMHDVSVPSGVTRAGIDALRIVPRKGDGMYSVGYIGFEP